MIKAYHNFVLQMKKYNFSISENRFLELCINPSNDLFDQKSTEETMGTLELEAQGLIKNLQQPKNRAVDLDFVAELSNSWKNGIY